jgi:hypothetical protein
MKRAVADVAPLLTGNTPKPRRRQTRRCIGVHGDKHVGLVLTGNVYTLAKGHEKIVIAHQLHVEALLLFKTFGEQLCDGQHHVLFPLTLGADGARVFTTVSGINHDNDVAFKVMVIRGCFTWNHCAAQHFIGVHQVEHQTVSLTILRCQNKAVQYNGSVQIENDPGIALTKCPARIERMAVSANGN